MKLFKQFRILFFALLILTSNQKCLSIELPELMQKSWVTLSDMPNKLLSPSNNILSSTGSEVTALNNLYATLWAQESATWWKLPWLWRIRSFSGITKEHVDLGSAVRSLRESRNKIAGALNLIDNQSVNLKQPWNVLKLARRGARWINYNILLNRPDKLSWTNPFNWPAKLINLPGEAGFDFSTGSKLHDSIMTHGITSRLQLDYALKLSKLKVDAIKNLDASLNKTPRLFGKGYEVIRKTHQIISKYKTSILSQHKTLMWEEIKFFLSGHPSMFWVSAATSTAATFSLYCFIMNKLLANHKHIAGAASFMATAATIYFMPSLLMLPGTLCLNPKLLIPSF